MTALGYDHETARRVALGMECVGCNEPFVRAHGTPTACPFCWPKMTADEREGVSEATHEEATKAHFINEARKRRSRKAHG